MLIYIKESESTLLLITTSTKSMLSNTKGTAALLRIIKYIRVHVYVCVSM